MNLKLFDELMDKKLDQHRPEWQVFLETCEIYLAKRGIKNPIVVELGTNWNSQKKFYERLFGAEHIGIDITARRSIPDIIGNSHDLKTVETLKKRLGGRLINILLIDANHLYDGLKSDFELYSPLCSDIVAFHDIEFRKRGVWKFWAELKTKACAEAGDYKNYLFISIYQHRGFGTRRQMGIGVIIKR